MSHETFYRLTSIGRPVDIRYASNRGVAAVMVLALLAAGGHALWSGAHIGEAGLVGGAALLTAFFSWALGRELDPDANATAFVGLAFAGAVFAALGTADLWALAIATPLSRVVNRTIGPPAKLSDSIIVVVVVAVAVLASGRWSMAIPGAAAFFIDAALGGKRRHYAFGLACLAVLGVALAQGSVALAMPAYPLMLGAVVLAFAVAIATLPPLLSKTDLDGYTLEYRRVQGGMFIALLVAVAAQFEAGVSFAAAGVSCVLVATVIGRALPRPVAAV